MISKFFHIPKNKRFNIPYRFYNPEQEEMDAREQRIKNEMGLRNENEFGGSYRANHIKGSFRQAMGDHSKTVTDARRKSNTRLVFFILVLALAFYLIYHFS